MRLSNTHEQIIRAYALNCHPEIIKGPEYVTLCSERFIHPEQDHITDKGCAYAIAVLGMSYTKFISRHKWQQRHAPVSRPVREVFHSKEEQDIYFQEKYKLNLKYNTWGQAGNEQQADPLTLTKIGTEICLALINHPKIDWKKVRGWMSSKDLTGNIAQIQSKEYLKTHLEAKLKKLES